MITNCKDLPDLRRRDPIALVQLYEQSHKPDEEPAHFLRRLSPDDDAWADVDWPAVAQSVWADAAAVQSILAQYPEPDYDEDDEDVRCAVCDAGDICRQAFETDADDVAGEADAPLAEVMRWMHAHELHSNTDSITALADRFQEERAALILMQRAPMHEDEAHG